MEILDVFEVLFHLKLNFLCTLYLQDLFTILHVVEKILDELVFYNDGYLWVSASGCFVGY